jgi:hypothetical protein
VLEEGKYPKPIFCEKYTSDNPKNSKSGKDKKGKKVESDK